MREACSGWVKTFKGQLVQVTGRIHVDGEWWSQAEVKRHVESVGDVSVPKGSRNARESILIAGELTSNVIDRRHRRSKNIVFVAEHRAKGHHICLIDEDGFTDLVNGRRAPCIQLERTTRGIRLSNRDGKKAPIGGDARHSTKSSSTPALDWVQPLRPRDAGNHRPVELEMDLNRLDRGTRAHEETRASLAAHLHEVAVVEARKPPLFDAGWLINDDTFVVAEVKSLLVETEKQQVRLGLGQVLEYAEQIRSQHPFAAVKAVLVLERAPAGVSWIRVAASASVHLTWAPDFPGLAANGAFTRVAR